MIKDSKDFKAEENSNVDERFFIIPNGNNEYDTISNYDGNIPDEGIKEEATTKKNNPIKDLEVNDIEFNNKTIGKKLICQVKVKKVKKKYFLLIILFYILLLQKKRLKICRKNKINFQRLYFKEYNSKFKQFITEYANNLLRKHLLCGKIQKPRVSLLKFNPKKKRKTKINSYLLL